MTMPANSTFHTISRQSGSIEKKSIVCLSAYTYMLSAVPFGSGYGPATSVGGELSLQAISSSADVALQPGSVPLPLRPVPAGQQLLVPAVDLFPPVSRVTASSSRSIVRSGTDPALR
uniref:Uncharacterized protein n=1 Tax=Anopheles coluzzii TaxID=1518534 RepID=A0A8W7PMK3_ANOCL